MYKKIGKRFFDLAVGFLVMVFCGPIYLVLALLVRMNLGAPILFGQNRPGLNGKPFRMIKFRSMTDLHDNQGRLLPDIDRLTPFGRFLRSTSLDELPELWNVLRGEMSLVGPRPLLMEYLPLYSPEQMRRHDMHPGITGWAQVNGRNAISWEEKFALDIWYVDNVSLWLDLKIIALTAWKMFMNEGIIQPGQATVEYFRGNHDYEQ